MNSIASTHSSNTTTANNNSNADNNTGSMLARTLLDDGKRSFSCQRLVDFDGDYSRDDIFNIFD